MSSSFITNKEKFLSDIINGILPKTNAVDILVGIYEYVEVVKPESVRKQMRNFAQTLMSYYKE